MNTNTKNESNEIKKAELLAKLAALEAEQKASQVAFPVTRTNSRGQTSIVGCKENTQALLAHYGLTCRYNEMTKEVEVGTNHEFNSDTKRNALIEFVADCARKQGYPDKVAISNLVMIANENAYHPARDWVLSKEWDGVDRLQIVFNALVTDETFNDELKYKIINRWMIANVALLMHSTPHESEEHQKRGFLGTEGVLVLQGMQGLSKTQFFQSLVPNRSEYFSDGKQLNPADKDSVALIISHWIVELGELDAVFRKADIAALRAWLTLKTDKYRPPYARTIDSYPRRTGICATVNDPEFLAETGENRRYWVIPVTAVHPLKDVDVQQMWAQAYVEYKSGRKFWFEPEERQELYDSNKQFERVDPLIELISQCVSDPFVEVADPHHDQVEKMWESIQDKPKPKKKPEVKLEPLGATDIIRKVFGPKKMLPQKAEVSAVSRWLKDKGFRTAANKKFHVRIDKTFDDSNEIFPLHK